MNTPRDLRAEGWQVELIRPPKTDRDLWAEPSHGFFAWSMTQQSRRADVSAGLRAFAAAWFDDYTDETDLPRWFYEFVAVADDVLGDLDIPGNDEEEG